MNTQKAPQNALEDIEVNLKVKIAAMWTSFMFLYAYVDIFGFYMPNKIDGILQGKVFEFDITQEFFLIVMVLVAIPSLMIFLSVALPPRANRWTNIIVATLLIPYMLFNLVGDAWPHMIFAAVVEVIQLLLIIRYAWQWPRTQTKA